MKRLWISLALLGSIFCATLANTAYLTSFTREITALLLQAEAEEKAENWEAAAQLTQQARNHWEGHSTYLHTTLRHADLDNIYISFLQVEKFLEYRKEGEYSAANATLIGFLDLLLEQEELTIKNIL